jgi:uncharacterized protein YggE
MRLKLPAVAVALLVLVGGTAVTAVAMTDSGAQPANQQDPVATIGQQPSQTLTQQPAQIDSAGPDGRSISVSAAGSAQTSPDQVTVGLSVVATGADAPTVRQAMAEDVSEMRAALTDIGVGDDQIQTERYDLGREHRPPSAEGEPQYRGEHSFTVTIADTDRAGEIIDTAVTSGADTIDSVRFTLSEDRRRSLRQDALRDAMNNARTQADTLAAESGLTVAGVHTVRTTDRGYGPRFESAALAADGGGGTSVDSGPVGVQVQVDVVYEVAAD